MSTPLRLLRDGVCPPEVNMPRDLALLEAFEQGEIPPTLRVYQWASPAITYGVNQQLPPRLVEASRRLGVPLFRRPTGGKAVLHGHDLTVSLVFSPHPHAALSDKGTTPEFNLAAPSAISSNLTPLSPLSVNGEGGISAPHMHGSPSPFTERGLGGEVEKAWEFVGVSPQVEATLCTLIRRGQGGEGVRIYPRQVYLQLAPALVEAFQSLGIPATQGDAAAPDPRSLDDGGDCFATPAIADIVHAETGVKLMGCALLVRGACVLMQASIPLRMPDVPVEQLFGHPHPKPPPLDADLVATTLYQSLQAHLDRVYARG